MCSSDLSKEEYIKKMKKSLSIYSEAYFSEWIINVIVKIRSFETSHHSESDRLILEIYNQLDFYDFNAFKKKANNFTALYIETIISKIKEVNGLPEHIKDLKGKKTILLPRRHKVYDIDVLDIFYIHLKKVYTKKKRLFKMFILIANTKNILKGIFFGSDTNKEIQVFKSNIYIGEPFSITSYDQHWSNEQIGRAHV